MRQALLDCLAAVSMLGALLIGLFYFGLVPEWVSGLLLISVACSAALWLVMRGSGRSAAFTSIVFACTATAAWFFANGTLGFGMVWLAAVVVARRFGGVVLAVYTLLVLGVGAGTHLIIGTEQSQIVVELAGALLFMLIGGLFAMILHASETAETRLRQANLELEERAGIERELVLAEERARTARGLHDGLGHRLTAIGLALEYAEQARDRDEAAAWIEVALARETARDALADMRRLVRAMHPVDIEDLRGPRSFTAVAQAFRSTGLDIRVLVSGKDREIPQQHLLVLLRLMQESLTNVVRHSDATSVRIRIASGTDELVARIDDDGLSQRQDGPGTDRRALAEGFGLRSLRERFEHLGGSLEFDYAEYGFSLNARLPLEGEKVTA